MKIRHLLSIHLKQNLQRAKGNFIKIKILSSITPSLPLASQALKKFGVTISDSQLTSPDTSHKISDYLQFTQKEWRIIS